MTRQDTSPTAAREPGIIIELGERRIRAPCRGSIDDGNVPRRQAVIDQARLAYGTALRRSPLP